MQEATFTPVTVRPMRETAGQLTALRTLMRNPAEVWSPRMYREHFLDSTFAGQRIIHTSDPQTFQEVLLTHQSAFPKSDLEHRLLSAGTGDGLLTTEGPVWKRQRKAASPVFRHDNMLALLPLMNRVGEDAGRSLAAACGETDVMPFMINATFDIIADTLLSGDDAGFDRERIARDVALFLETLGQINVFDLVPGLDRMPRFWGRAGRAAVRRLREDADRAIGFRRAQGGEKSDLLSFLMSAKDAETGVGLSDIELRDNIITFIGAGHETTSLVLTWTLYLLANAPEWQTRLLEEAGAVCGDGPVEAAHLDQLEAHAWVLNEAMRLYPPAPAMARKATEDLALTNVTVKRGDQIVLALYPMHRHEALWDAPEVFDPERFSQARSVGRHRFQFIPFSGGPRICIGMRFAMMEAIILLVHALRAVSVAPAKGFLPYPKSRITLRPRDGMRLSLSQR